MYNERKYLFRNRRGKKVATKISYVVIYVKLRNYNIILLLCLISGQMSSFGGNVEDTKKITPLLIHTANVVFVL